MRLLEEVARQLGFAGAREGQGDQVDLARGQIGGEQHLHRGALGRERLAREPRAVRVHEDATDLASGLRGAERVRELRAAERGAQHARAAQRGKLFDQELLGWDRSLRLIIGLAAGHGVPPCCRGLLAVESDFEAHAVVDQREFAPERRAHGMSGRQPNASGRPGWSPR